MMTPVAEWVALVIVAPVFGFALRKLRLPVVWAVGLPAAGFGFYALVRFLGLTAPQATTSTLFAVCYALIVSERIHRTRVALAGAAAVLLLQLVDQHTALHGHGEVAGVDWNTILLLISMMIVVDETQRTGVFEWIAIKAAKLARGKPVLIIVYLSIATALVSAFLDNVTTVLLFAPVTILICESLGVDAVPYLISVIVASNLGGTATLIGDPPNIMIGSAARIGFMEFLHVDGPIALAALVVFVLTMWIVFRRRLQVAEQQRKLVMEFDETKAITNPRLLRHCSMVIAGVLVGFCVHGSLGLEPATVALAGAAVILLISRTSLQQSFQAVEWETIFFYLGLFIMCSALVQVGVVRIMADGAMAIAGVGAPGQITSAQLVVLTIGVLWFSALTAAIMGNVAFVPIMNAIIMDLAVRLHGPPADPATLSHLPQVYPLWWALSLGACFGGNLTLVGAGANVVVAGIADRAKHPIGFVRYMKYGVPLAVQSLVLASFYLWLRFLR